MVGGGGGDGEVFLIHPHFDIWVEEVGVGGGIFGDDLGDGGAPACMLGYEMRAEGSGETNCLILLL